MQENWIKSRILGSLIGGAIGDALGYPIEFWSYDEIRQQYGAKGITRFNLQNGVALVSDDTQMTMFTANGLLRATTQLATQTKHDSIASHITTAYLEWLQTQYVNDNIPSEHTCWIRNIERLQCHRCPGTTCLSALNEIANKREVKNDSKGCGGIMRIAPIALHAAATKQYISHEEAIQLGGDAARITHKHPLGWISAALISHIIYEQVLEEKPTREKFCQSVMAGRAILNKLYPEQIKYIDAQYNLIDLAIKLAENSNNDHTSIDQIGGNSMNGGGWVGEETLAIAIYCTYKYFDNFEKAMIASVNHTGDSDSTGAVTGNLIGSIIGFEAIPHYYLDDLEFTETLTFLAEDLARKECPLCDKNSTDEERQRWTELYVNSII